MFSKWKINLPGMEFYRFGEDKALYRLPFTSGKRCYSLRKIKKSRGCWVINGERWSEHQLRAHLVLDESPIELTKTDDLPF